MSADLLRSELLTLLGAHGYTAGPSGRIVHVARGVAVAVLSGSIGVTRQGRSLFTTTSTGALDLAGRILRAVAADPVDDLVVGLKLIPKSGGRDRPARIAGITSVPQWPVALAVYELVDAEDGLATVCLLARSVEERFTWAAAS